MDSSIFIELLEHEEIKKVPLTYVIVVFSAIQDILEAKRVDDLEMERS